MYSPAGAYLHTHKFYGKEKRERPNATERGHPMAHAPYLILQSRNRMELKLICQPDLRGMYQILLHFQLHHICAATEAPGYISGQIPQAATDSQLPIIIQTSKSLPQKTPHFRTKTHLQSPCSCIRGHGNARNTRRRCRRTKTSVLQNPATV